MSGSQYRGQGKSRSPRRKAKGEMSEARAFNQAKGKLYDAGRQNGKKGRVLTHWVGKVLQAATA